ncbi:MAG: hypothetical protein E6L01_01990 [Thaumarchaeota archaeon]|nr:MAG: hypothetical protein E6L01_01990 [Nitrososphaerota archaeon]
MVNKDVDILFALYDIYDRNRDSILWFLEEFSANSYEEYKQKYHGVSKDRSHFIRVCGFFELSGTLIKRRLIHSDIYFDVFNPNPFWQKAKPIVDGMRHTRPYIYENFELLNEIKLKWSRKRTKNKK